MLGLAGLCALLVVVLVTAGALAVRRPAWYQPAPVVREQLTRDKQDFVNLIDQIGVALNSGRTATFRLQRDQVNRWITARNELPFHEFDTRPFEQICVDFRTSGVWIAATARIEGFALVVAAGVSAQIERDVLHLRVEGLRIGSLPVPAALVARWIGRAPAPIRALPHGDDLTWTARNRFIWENGKQPFRFEAIEARGDELRITLVPLPR
jgi:hypothetical protein